jgi:hypothetical protein
MTWKRKGKYYMENEDGDTITWDDRYDNCLLFIKGKPVESFYSVKDAIEYYNKLGENNE